MTISHLGIIATYCINYAELFSYVTQYKSHENYYELTSVKSESIFAFFFNVLFYLSRLGFFPFFLFFFLFFIF